MEKYFVLYNPLSNNKRGEKETKQLESLLGDCEISYFDQTAIDDKAAFFESIPEDTSVIVSGGDGTIHNFINGISGIDIKRNVYYFASGTGNDFLTDINGEKGKLILVNKYIENLPVVEVKGKKYKFLNNVVLKPGNVKYKLVKIAQDDKTIISLAILLFSSFLFFIVIIEIINMNANNCKTPTKSSVGKTKRCFSYESWSKLTKGFCKITINIKLKNSNDA